MFDICDLDEDVRPNHKSTENSPELSKRQQLKQKLQEKKLQRTSKSVLYYKLQRTCNYKPKNNTPKQDNVTN